MIRRMFDGRGRFNRIGVKNRLHIHTQLSHSVQLGDRSYFKASTLLLKSLQNVCIRVGLNRKMGANPGHSRHKTADIGAQPLF